LNGGGTSTGRGAVFLIRRFWEGVPGCSRDPVTRDGQSWVPPSLAFRGRMGERQAVRFRTHSSQNSRWGLGGPSKRTFPGGYLPGLGNSDAHDAKGVAFTEEEKQKRKHRGTGIPQKWCLGFLRGVGKTEGNQSPVTWLKSYRLWHGGGAYNSRAAMQGEKNTGKARKTMVGTRRITKPRGLTGSAMKGSPL